MNNIYIAFVILSVLLACCSQIILKKSASKTFDNKLAEYLNINVILAYGLFALSAALSMYSLRYLELSFVSILQSTGYIFVPVLSFFILKERLNKLQIVGMMIIFLGIFIFNL